MSAWDIENCESHIEKELFRALDARERIGEWSCQRPAHRYRPDFTIRAGGLNTVIECDGREFHRFYKDRKRDAILISRGGVDQIIRLKGADIGNRISECMEFIERVAPQLFSVDFQLPSMETLNSLHEMMFSIPINPILRQKHESGKIIEVGHYYYYPPSSFFDYESKRESFRSRKIEAREE